MSTPPPSSFFDLEMENESWWHAFQPLRDELEQVVSPEDETLRDAPLSPLFSPPPSPPPSQPALVLPIPAPPVVTGGTEPQITAPPVPFDEDVVVNDVLERTAFELNEESRPKQSRAAAKREPKQQAPKRVTKRAAKPPKPLSANKLAKLMDREGWMNLAQRQAAKAASEMAAAQPVYGTPGQLYGQNQFGQIYGQNPFCPPAPGHYSQAAGPFYQQPPSLPPLALPLAPHLAPAPALVPALAPPPAPYPASHLAPAPAPDFALSPSPTFPSPPRSPIQAIGLGMYNRRGQYPLAAPWHPFVTEQPQNMYQQHQNGYNMF